MLEHLTWTNIAARPEIIVPPLIFYFIFFWLLPMVGCINTKEAPRHTLMPYWKAVGQVSGLFHIGAIIAGIIVWFLYPYMVIS